MPKVKEREYQTAFVSDDSEVKIFHSAEKLGGAFLARVSLECQVAEDAGKKCLASNVVIAPTRHIAKKASEAAASIVVCELEKRFEDERKYVLFFYNKSSNVKVPVALGRFCYIRVILESMELTLKKFPHIAKHYGLGYTDKNIDKFPMSMSDEEKKEQGNLLQLLSLT